MPEPQEPVQPANSTGHTLLVIGEVPMDYLQKLALEIGLTSFVRVTYRQACVGRATIADALGDGMSNEATVLRYFSILTDGFTPGLIAAVLVDEQAWEDSDNIFVNGPSAMFYDVPTYVYREPQVIIVGPVDEPTIELVRT